MHSGHDVRICRGKVVLVALESSSNASAPACFAQRIYSPGLPQMNINFFETPTGWKFFGNLMDSKELGGQVRFPRFPPPSVYVHPSPYGCVFFFSFGVNRRSIYTPRCPTLPKALHGGWCCRRTFVATLINRRRQHNATALKTSVGRYEIEAIFLTVSETPH